MYVPKRTSSRPKLSTKLTVGEVNLQQIFARSSDTRVVKSKATRKKTPSRPQKTVGTILTQSETEIARKRLIEYCLTHMQDSYRVHLSRLKGLKILETMSTCCNIDDIESEAAMHMVWAALSCIHHFLLRLKSGGGLLQWLRRRQARKSIRAYDRVLKFLAPKHFALVFSAVVTFFEEANLWDIELFCSHLLQRVLVHGDDKDRPESISEIISLAETSTITSTITSRQIIKVLLDIGETDRWSWMNNRLIDRLLDMYYCSITPDEPHDYNYESLEKSLETCVRSMSVHVSEKHQVFMMSWMLEAVNYGKIPDETIMTFGNVLEYIATLYTKRVARRPLSEQLLPAVLRTIASKNLLCSMLGHRTLQNLIDRCNNKIKFDGPRVFLRNSHYNIVLNQNRHSDKLLFQRYREIIHQTTIDSILTHGRHMIYIEHTYVSIALFLVEIPCAYTASAGACLCMALQDAALTNKRMHMDQANRIHATVLSLMSLICYIHKAAVFYDYVDKILDKRADFAPHLNPPLQVQYKYASHHVVWNEPDLFFEDWETRYGLWRCFKTTRDVVVVKVE